MGMRENTGLRAPGGQPQRKRVFTVGIVSAIAASDFVAAGVNDHLVINQAIAAASSVGGGVVQIGAGTFDIAGAVTMKSNVRLEGVGYATHLKLKGGANSNLIEGYNLANVGIFNLRLNGNATMAAAGAGNAATQNVDPGNSQDATGSNINLQQVDRLEIAGIYSHDAVFHGIFVRDQYGSSKHVNIHDCWLFDNGYRALHIHGQTSPSSISMTEMRVADNFSFNNGRMPGAGSANAGIFAIFHNMKHVILSGNVIHGENGRGLEVTGALTSGDSLAEKCLISGNVVSDCIYSLTLASGIKKCVVSDNVFDNAASANVLLENGVVGGSAGSELIISGNLITGDGSGVATNARRGIQLGNNVAQAWSRITIKGNVISGHGDAAIYGANLGNFSYLSIEDNTIADNVNQGIRIVGGGSYTAREFQISNNRLLANGGRAIHLTSVDHFKILGNVAVDNFSGSGTSIDLAICTYGLVSGNSGGAVSKTLTGNLISTSGTCTEITFAFNEAYGMPNVLGLNSASNCRVLDNFGACAIYIDSTATNTIVRDNRNTASPYLTDNSSSTIVSRHVPPPASATAAGRKGDWAKDASYRYECTATNTWVRASTGAGW